MKYLSVNMISYVSDLCNKAHKVLMKETKKQQNKTSNVYKAEW